MAVFFQRTYTVTVITADRPHDDADLEVLAYDLGPAGTAAGGVRRGPAERLDAAEARRRCVRLGQGARLFPDEPPAAAEDDEDNDDDLEAADVPADDR